MVRLAMTALGVGRAGVDGEWPVASLWALILVGAGLRTG